MLRLFVLFSCLQVYKFICYCLRVHFTDLSKDSIKEIYCYDLASLEYGSTAGDLKIEVAIVQIIMFRPKPAQFERRILAANPLVLDNSLFSGVGIVSAAASKWMKKSLKKWAGLVLGGQKWCKDHFFFLL